MRERGKGGGEGGGGRLLWPSTIIIVIVVVKLVFLIDCGYWSPNRQPSDNGRTMNGRGPVDVVGIACTDWTCKPGNKRRPGQRLLPCRAQSREEGFALGSQGGAILTADAAFPDGKSNRVKTSHLLTSSSSSSRTEDLHPAPSLVWSTSTKGRSARGLRLK